MQTRRKWLISATCGAVASVGYPIVVEPHWLELTHTHVAFPRALRRTVRVLHLADFHASFWVSMSMIEHAIQTGLNEQPDLICVTGDFISHQHDFDAVQYIKTLSKLARNQEIPVYAVLGNHDGGKWAPARHGYADHTIVDRILDHSGIQLLHNRHERITLRGAELNVVGVGDLWSEEIDAPAAFTGIDRSLPTLLLSHNPDSKTTLQNYYWDLMLAGHTHGGQVIIPFEGPRYAPVEDRRYVAGLRSWGERQIFVTRGVGNLGGVRFRCRPEVSVLTLS